MSDPAGLSFWTLSKKEKEEACPNGDPWCEAEDDLREGALPCFECFLEAPESLIETFNRRRSA